MWMQDAGDEVLTMAGTRPVTQDAVAELRQESFDDFFRVHREPIFRAIALTIGDRDLAAEATDEAMVRTFERWRRVRDYTNPPGWAYRVALNWARSRLRRRKFRDDRPVPEVGGIDESPSDPTLLAAVAVLPMEQRSVIVLRFFLDWSQEQIAEALDLPVGTVKSRTTRALERLRHMRGVQP
jgi:RNA polymerase sigma-70 factor (ECF subfamily)